MSGTLNTIPYTPPRTNENNRFAIPNQRLPITVLENLALVLAVAVNHHALLVLNPYLINFLTNIKKRF